MNSIDGNDGYNTTPILKKKLSDRLVISGITENVNYIIEEIKDPSIFTENDPPKVNEKLMLSYSFSPYHGYYGYETLDIIVFRDNNGKIHNYVQYFKNIKEVEDFFSKITLKVDKEYAISRINKLIREINTIKKDYVI